MDIYTFKKIPGGATFQKNGEKQHGVHPGNIVHVDVEDATRVTVTGRGLTNQIRVDLDTVVIDETDIGGASHTYNPSTATATEMQKMIMNVFNPSSNYLMP